MRWAPRFLARLFYAVRGKRRVRYHLFDGKGGQGQTLEGIEVGCWAGHYVMLMPTLISGPEQTIPLDGTVEIARERVIFRQVLT